MRQVGRYRVDECVGSGAFATVWRGYDPELDATVAIKVLADNWAMHADVRQRFLSEARLLHAITDPRVVRVHDVGEEAGRPYFVMDHVRGGSLADCVGAVGREEAVRLTCGAAEAVQVLHDAGLLHRDIKPGNVLIDRTRDPARVLVADLGSAKRLADASGFTATIGTPAYMAPEVVSGAALDVRADVYSLGMLGWELLNGSRPGPSAHGTDAVTRLLLRAMDPDPDRRPDSAAAFARALRAAGSAAQADAVAPDDREVAGGAPAPGTPAGETPAGETPAGETSAGETPSGETLAGWPAPLVWVLAAVAFAATAWLTWLLV